MKTRFSSWRQIRGRLLLVINGRLLLVISGIIILLAFIGFSIAAYRSQWKWAGFSDKTVWDWLTLLFVPIAVGLGVYLLDQRQKARDRWLEQQREEDKQHEAILEAYKDKMSELLLNKDNPLRESAEEDEVRKIARMQTLTVVLQLDGKQKGSVVQFLHESGLISTNQTIIDLTGANLSGVILSGFQLREANLSRTDLSGASCVLTELSRANLNGADLKGANLSLASLYHTNLSGAYLDRAYLSGADLFDANLSGAYLDGADLSGAYLTQADLSGAHLSGTYIRGRTSGNIYFAPPSNAKITKKQLEQAKSLKGATMPDGSKHP
jgi:uncharacterized protein YjbI with pentapeptide repeats